MDVKLTQHFSERFMERVRSKPWLRYGSCNQQEKEVQKTLEKKLQSFENKGIDKDVIKVDVSNVLRVVGQIKGDVFYAKTVYVKNPNYKRSKRLEKERLIAKKV